MRREGEKGGKKRVLSVAPRTGLIFSSFQSSIYYMIVISLGVYGKRPLLLK